MMEKKNMLLLSIFGVATLMVAVVGATFAFFTATTTTSNTASSASDTTTTIGDVTLTMSAATNSTNVDYPGGYLVVGAKVVAKHTGSATYNVSYTVNGTVDATNISTTSLTWTLYEVSSSVTTPVSGCTVKETASSGTTQYTYTGCTVSTTITGGTKVTNGTVVAGNSATITASGETLATTTSGKTTYYYLVVQFPETSSNQDADQGKTITASLTSVSNGTAARA